MNTRALQNAIILFDKPEGKTSYRAIEEVKRRLKIGKIGHSGTLDKSASGLLVLCTGRFTRLTRYFLESDKTYIGRIRLGIVTDTGDAEGRVTATADCSRVDETVIKGIKEHFTGEISQTPPEYSAVKIGGMRASDRMRKGLGVQLQPRTVTIRELNILGLDLGECSLTIEVLCTKGTYMRALARDIGIYLGTGACLEFLRRTGVGGLDIRDAATVQELEDYAGGQGITKEFIVNPADAFPRFGRVVVKDTAVRFIGNGVPFGPSDVVSAERRDGQRWMVMDSEKNLIAIAAVDLDNWSVAYYNVIHDLDGRSG